MNLTEHFFVRLKVDVLSRRMLAAFPNRFGKLLENFDGGFPVDTSISDADTLLKTRRSLRWYLLVAFVDVGFNHDTDDGFLASTELFTNNLGYLGLVSVVFVGVS